MAFVLRNKLTVREIERTLLWNQHVYRRSITFWLVLVEVSHGVFSFVSLFLLSSCGWTMSDGGGARDDYIFFQIWIKIVQQITLA